MRNLKVNNEVVENVKVNNTQVQTVKCNNVTVWLNKVWKNVNINYTGSVGGNGIFTYYSGNLGRSDKKKNLNLTLQKHFNHGGTNSKTIYFEGSLNNSTWFNVYTPITFDTPTGVGNTQNFTITTNNTEFVYFRIRVSDDDDGVNTTGLKLNNALMYI